MATTPQPASPSLLRPKPKRVRREKLERDYFRDLAGKLEAKLTLLQFRRLNYGVTNAACSDHLSSRRGPSSAWMDLAIQEVRNYERAQNENQQLRAAIQEQSQLASKLRLLLLQAELPAKLTGLRALERRRKFWDLANDPEEDIFADQLVNVAKLRLEVQQQLYQAPHVPVSTDLSWGLSRGFGAISKDPQSDTGIMLEVHCKTTVPFSLEVAARAYWRLFCTEHGELLGADRVVNLSTDTIARSFSLRLEFEGLVSDTSGKYTCQKQVDADGIEIAWVEHVDVREFGGAQFHGMQYQKRAIMKLRRVPHETPGHQSTSTEVETHFETYPIFHESVTDPSEQTRTFINCASQAHNKLDAIVCQHTSNLLLEEDWKATFGSIYM